MNNVDKGTKDYLMEIITKGTLEQKYEYYQMYVQIYPQHLQKDLKCITWGKNTELQFHIRKWLNNKYEEYEKTGEIRIDDRIYNIEEVWEEIDSRKSLIMKNLLNLASDDNVLWGADS